MSSRSPLLSAADVSDDDVGRVSGQRLEVCDVSRGNHRPSCDIAHRDDEGVHSSFRSGARVAKQLTGPYADTRVDRVHLDPLPSKPRENCRVSGMPAHDLGQDCCHRPYRELAVPHLRNECPYPITARRWTVRRSRDRFTVEQQHQPARRLFDFFDLAASH